MYANRALWILSIYIMVHGVMCIVYMKYLKHNHTTIWGIKSEKTGLLGLVKRLTGHILIVFSNCNKFIYVEWESAQPKLDDLSLDASIVNGITGNELLVPSKHPLLGVWAVGIMTRNIILGSLLPQTHHSLIGNGSKNYFSTWENGIICSCILGP